MERGIRRLQPWRNDRVELPAAVRNKGYHFDVRLSDREVSLMQAAIANGGKVSDVASEVFAARVARCALPVSAVVQRLDGKILNPTIAAAFYRGFVRMDHKTPDPGLVDGRLCLPGCVSLWKGEYAESEYQIWEVENVSIFREVCKRFSLEVL